MSFQTHIPKSVESPSYPYWAKNQKNDAFLVTKKDHGICVAYWQDTQTVIESMLIRFQPGEKIIFENLD